MNIMGRREKDQKPRFFRRRFTIDTVPRFATLYISGPRSIQAFINGTMVLKDSMDPDSLRRIRVFAVAVAPYLKAGSNVIAISAIHGMPLAAKILPAARSVNAAPLVISDDQWRVSPNGREGWEKSSFADSSWARVETLGGIEGSIDLLQFNADAGLYDWPGYDGISPFLAHHRLVAASLDPYEGSAKFENLGTLTSDHPAPEEFMVHLPPETVREGHPHILLDFGKEISGRIRLVSDSAQAADLSLQYGESKEEALHQPFLGETPIHLTPHAKAYGPKSAFRYVLIRFLGSNQNVSFKSIDADVIYYPVKYQGYFESSDQALNKMWAVGAYTAHLCMQDDIWDAPKRDRGRWMGDLDVSGRTINDVFADHYLVEDTISHLVDEVPPNHYINNIAGYSAAFIRFESDYYLHIGSEEQLRNLHGRILDTLQVMTRDLNGRSIYSNLAHAWVFVDWSPYLNEDTSDARAATQFEFYGAFIQGAYLLRKLGDVQNAEKYEQLAASMKAASQQSLLDHQLGSFGTRAQVNAAAVLYGVADEAQYPSIWTHSLSLVGKVPYERFVITPYYGYYVIEAMAKMGHRAEALDWIRNYWGGMLAEGATSYWEAYDPYWHKRDFHGSLQADNRSGYFVSLAHGWSSGVVPWLMDQIVGINPAAPGFSVVDIRPNLAGLSWVRGGEPTPRGMIEVSVKQRTGETEVQVDLPPSTTAHISLLLTGKERDIAVNGKTVSWTPEENGTRAAFVLNTGGHFQITAK